VAYVHPGDRVNVVTDTPDGPPGTDTTVEGVVAEVARAIGADERAFTVKVSLPPTVTARTGSFARVLFRGPPRRIVRVPAAAIRRYGQVSSVYVVEGSVARMRLVQIGASSAQGAEVLAGLDAGESIVMSPPQGLMDGARVTATAEPAHPRGVS